MTGAPQAGGRNGLAPEWFSFFKGVLQQLSGLQQLAR
jgi:hypothetical protein